MTFHDFLWPFPVFQDLRLSCQFKKVKTFTCFGGFFDLKQFNRQTLAITKMLASLFFIVLALSTAVNNLSNKTLIFHDFQGSRIKFHDFPGLEMKFINSMTFQVFHDLYDPWVRLTGTRHTAEPVERGWEGSCLCDELPHYKTPENASCTYVTLCYDPQARVFPTHAQMCQHRWPPGERKRSLLLTLLNYI